MHRGIIYFLLGLSLSPQPAPAGETGLFGSSEIKSENLQPFQKWNRVVGHMLDGESEEKPRECPPQDGRALCRKQQWEAFLADFTAPLNVDHLRAINQYVNQRRYIIDPINWGVPDYWAVPWQFFLKDGDCEDYAITKYVSLKLLGYATEAMRIVIVQDNNLDAIHAVLAVQLNNATYILDNQIEQVVPHSVIAHYTPIYSINEHAWWRHLPAD